MKYKSKWNDDLEKGTYESLREDITCDVLIIGGGLTGLSTAYHLNDVNLKVVLVERNYLGSGASSRSTAKINYLQDILSKISSNKVNEYIKSQRYGMTLLTNIINKNKIKCDLEKKTSYLFGNTDKEIMDIKKIEGYLKESNISYQKEPMPIDIKHKYSISVNDTYTFNPGLYINGLKKLLTNIDIYENTNVEKILKSDNYYVAYTKNNKIKAQKIVMASWYPFFVKPFFFPLKAHLEKSYLSCFKTKNKKDITGINLSKEVKSFQYTKEYFIYLINSHILCNGDNHINFKGLTRLKPEFVWSNIDIITNDHLPFVGEIQDNLYLGTGYNTWGNINSCLAGKILSDIILDKDNKYIEFFNPKRHTTFQKLGNNLINCFCNMKAYIKYLLERQEKVYYEGDKAIYVSPKGRKYMVKKRCPHLKCTLIFNKEEHTWDCPCHGSRFDLEGNTIFGPSEYDIKIDNGSKK